MKLGILADIHEQDDELRKGIDVLKRHGADCFIVLGDVCDAGRRLEETVALLRDVAAIGVWGNHDMGFCIEPPETNRQRYSKEVLDFMGSLQPRLEVEGCLFTHIEPWLDPHKIEDLWDFGGGSPDTQEKLDRSFAAAPNRVMFTGHFHRWIIGSTAGMIPWNGEEPIKLDFTKRHLVVVNAVCSGHCALFDTMKNEIIPVTL